jgi:ferrous iron transport protein A
LALLNGQLVSAIKLLSELKRGQKAVIDSFTDFDASLKLLEMGCIPGEEIEVVRIAPLGDPMAIMVAGYLLSLRKDEAAVMKVKLIS